MVIKKCDGIGKPEYRFQELDVSCINDVYVFDDAVIQPIEVTEKTLCEHDMKYCDLRCSQKERQSQDFQGLFRFPTK
jgi:hypothetical protein